jgi:gas vesicle protein
MKAFLTGLGIGVCLGIVFAPNSGEVTRRKVRHGFTGLEDDLGQEVHKAKDVIQETVAAYAEGSSEQERKSTEASAGG